MTLSAEGIQLAPVSKSDWIEAATEIVMTGARVHYVPATESFLADAPGDAALAMWAIGPTKADALAALADKARSHFARQLAKISE